jgi:hypothetical protein
MIALQEELDWDVYRRYGLLSEAEAMELIADPEYLPGLQLGERAFEFLLAERLEGAQGEKQWFERHHSVPLHEIPQHWPREYQDIVRKRIKFIRENRNIGLVERPEYKRRWESKEWSIKEKAAIKSWLLDRCEDRSLWFGADEQPRPITVNRLTDLLRADADVVAVARLYAGDADADLADVLKELIADEHVPYLAQLRYKGEGLIKRAVWERTWQLQRKEDAGEPQDIPVPPKYKNTDFHKPSYWRNRGKLDVPKERFISYPKASPDSDGSLLLGWAGWDHSEQTYALVTLIEERETTDGWDSDRIRPLVDGLAEVMPWVRQWHNEVDSDGRNPADVYDAYLNDKRIRHGLAE